MTAEEAEALQRLYWHARYEWTHDPENGIEPWPKRVGRPPKRKPAPGVLDLDAEDDG